MKFFVILSALTTLATASLVGDNLLDDEGLIARNNIWRQMMIPKPWNSFWTKLGFQQTIPIMTNREEISGMYPMPWWMCKDSSCLHQLMLKRTPMMNVMLHKTPNMLGIDSTLSMTHMPWWMCKDTACLLRSKLQRTPNMMDTMLHKTPNMLQMDRIFGMSHMPWWMCTDSTCSNQMMSHMSPIMMQTMHPTPMMHMKMNPMTINDRMTPMMQMEVMTPTDMNTIGHLMRMTQSLPLEDTGMINGDMTTRNNFWNMYKNMDTIGHKMTTHGLLDDEVMY